MKEREAMAEIGRSLAQTLAEHTLGERDALIAALVAEYRDVLARRGHWRRPWSGYYGGAGHALERVAERLGVTDLHERAAEVVARGEFS